MKNIATVFLLVGLFFTSVSLQAQEKKKSKFLEGLTKVMDALDTIAGDENTSSSSSTETENSSSSQEGKNEKKEKSSPVKISSIHPDIFIEYVSCQEVSGSVQVNFKITNNGPDNTIIIYTDHSAYDNEGNQYSNMNIKLGNVSSSSSLKNTLPSGVPLKFEMLISNVEPAASKIARITIRMAGYDYELINGTLAIENIPISR